MKLQFAFGANPEKGKAKRRGAKKSLARRKKRQKTKGSVHIKVSKGKHVAKRRKKKVKKSVAKKYSAKVKRHSKRRKKSKKNPYYIARKGGKNVGHGRQVPEVKDRGLVKQAFLKAKKAYEESDKNSAARSKARLAYVKAMKKDQAADRIDAEERKAAERFEQEGAQVKWYKNKSKKGASVAKRKKRKSKKVRKARKAKKAVKVKAKKHRRRRKKSQAKKVKVAKVSKVKRSKRRKSSRRKKRAKVYSHKHSTSVRHFKKGRRLKVKASAGRGKKRLSLSGFLKINPFRRNPMKDLKAYTGMSGEEMGALALGGALVPAINAVAPKIPGMSTVTNLINQYLGPQAAGSVIPVLAGVAANAVAEHLLSGQSAKYAKLAGEGLVAAGVMGLAMSLSQQYILPNVPGLHGINYTPMNGINYTPMSGINYTPMSGMGIMPQLNGMGIQPQLNGMGRSPDFGSADYGGNGGYTQAHPFQNADFGHALDEDCDEVATDDDISSDNLSGSMG